MSDLSLPRLARLSRLSPRKALAALWRRIGRAREIRRHRLDLARLDTRLLQDIGLSRGEAETEAARPFWDAPGHWYR